MTMNKNNSTWIAGIARGHNAGVCLLKDGEVVFSIEEERLSRTKYDGGPLASIVKILEYTDKLDYLIVAHTQPLQQTGPTLEFSMDDAYTGLCRKLGLIDRHNRSKPHPQVIDVAMYHHQLHAACSFYRSGFEDAVAVVIDGAGTFIPMSVNREETYGFETETLFNCSYPANFSEIGKHVGTRGPHPVEFITQKNEAGEDYEITVSDRAGIVKVYEAVTQYCGFMAIEAGKTMGLFPYGQKNDKIPELFDNMGRVPLSNRNVIAPTYPNAALVNEFLYTELASHEIDDGTEQGEKIDLTLHQNRRDLAYACQIQTQQAASNLIREAVERSGKKKVVVSGGYGLNCVANYHYLKDLEDLGIEIYVEPVSNDAGTAMGAALLMYHKLSNSSNVRERKGDNLYLGPKYSFTSQQLKSIAKEFTADIKDNVTNEEVVDLITSKNIVAVFQGQSENGPRALGNRSLLYDPTDPNGKDHVNEVKHREYFRPFAGSILEEDAHEWFDLRGMDSSPTMMYAVNCQPGIKEKIPAIIHVDDTCRIQTVNQEQNKNYYDLIKAFKEKTGCPIIFNTSFNLGGEPLVETLDDALRTLQNSRIEYLYLPEYNTLFKIENE